MRIFFAFLVIVTAAILFLFPISESVYDFRTDQRSDDFPAIVTAPAVTTANVTLLESLYDADTGTTTLTSDNAADSPAPGAYTSATRVLTVTGLSANDTRDLSAAYDVDALTGSDAIDDFAEQLDVFFLLLVLVFLGVSIVAIFLGRA